MPSIREFLFAREAEQRALIYWQHRHVRDATWFPGPWCTDNDDCPARAMAQGVVDLLNELYTTNPED